MSEIDLPSDFFKNSDFKNFAKGAFIVWLASTLLFKLIGINSYGLKTGIALLICFTFVHIGGTKIKNEVVGKAWLKKIINTLLLFFAATLISKTVHALSKLPLLELAAQIQKNDGEPVKAHGVKDNRKPELFQFWYEEK